MWENDHTNGQWEDDHTNSQWYGFVIIRRILKTFYAAGRKLTYTAINRILKFTAGGRKLRYTARR